MRMWGEIAKLIMAVSPFDWKHVSPLYITSLFGHLKNLGALKSLVTNMMEDLLYFWKIGNTYKAAMKSLNCHGPILQGHMHTELLSSL